ncbi:ankyrin repeat domain-containing protein [Vibrio sp. ZSDE26]|uniref:Ankyrin repeat domain-containing protein n=1 Tax=Vibrio amylolyticus TaxID=2847292 RepID=A0A9X1XK65_9VIBR|nr:ankyrin repeat domain-containing protein [Vibrio amylolyticus]MCK6263388.1 ankyrin repeat domain-containing protein [Vibrio amylolyticus]
MLNSALETINKLLITIALLMFITYGWQHAFSPRAKNLQMIQEAGYSVDRNSLTDAIAYGDEHIIEALLTFNIDISRPDVDGYLPLPLAIEMEHSKTIELLIAKGANINSVDPDGGYPMWYAADTGNKKIIEQLLSHGASLNKLDEINQTILMFAAAEGEKELFNYGIKVGVSPLSQDDEGDTMLHYAAYAEMYEMYQWIAKKFPELTTVKNVDGMTAEDIVNF